MRIAMKTKSLRLPEDLLSSLELVEANEHIEEAAAIRKLLRMGLETYVVDLYRQGRMTLREAAERLGLSQTAMLDRLLHHGVTGNLEAADVLASINQFI
jgi:predicted HTH domain antitoxin